MGLIIQRKGIVVGSTGDMKTAFGKILDEIIEHVIEGICFEAHRAVKLGYFSDEEYILKECEFVRKPEQNDQKLTKENDEIFGNKDNNVRSTCHLCKQKMAATAVWRHMRRCKSKPDNLDNSGKTENCENGVNGKNSYGQLNYDTMSPEQRHEFLSKRCGVISMRTGKPCNNTLKCSNHSKEDQDKVRETILEHVADYLADGNIDIDTVD